MSSSEKYYRLTNQSEIHRGLQYHDGLNVDPVEFSPAGTCSAGGMYFFSREELAHFYRHVSVEDAYWIREVTLPAGARVHLEDGKRKADQFILGPRRKFYMEDDDLFTPLARLAALARNGYAIQFIKGPSAEERLAAVMRNGGAIQYIKNCSPEERLAAVKQNGCAILFIKDPTAEERLAAIKQDGWAIHYIKDPSAEERLAAVKHSYAIQYIKNPSSEERLAAVKQRESHIR